MSSFVESVPMFKWVFLFGGFFKCVKVERRGVQA
jgi:hypothetical protein